MSKVIAVHQPNYLPWIGYFDKMSKCDEFVILDDVQILRGSGIENRNKIRNNKGWQWLTIPIKKKSKGFQKVNMVEIDNSSDWAGKHYGSIMHAYTKAPFFKEHHVFFKELYSHRYYKMIDINLKIIKYIKERLNIPTELIYSSDLSVTHKGSERIVEIMKILNGDIYLSGGGDSEYMEFDSFNNAGISIRQQNFVHPEYDQIHGEFISCMSIIDLLFNQGASVANKDNFIKNQYQHVNTLGG